MFGHKNNLKYAYFSWIKFSIRVLELTVSSFLWKKHSIVCSVANKTIFLGL